MNRRGRFSSRARAFIAGVLCAGVSGTPLAATTFHAPGVEIEIQAFPGVNTSTEFQLGQQTRQAAGTVFASDSLLASAEMIRPPAVGSTGTSPIRLYAETFDEASASISGKLGTLKARSTGFTSIGPVVEPGMDAVASSFTRVTYYDDVVVHGPVLPLGQAGLFSVQLTMTSTLATTANVSGHEIYNSFSIERETPAGDVEWLTGALLQASVHGLQYDFTFEYQARAGDTLHLAHELQTLATAMGPLSSYDVDASHTAIATLQVLSEGFYLTSAIGGFTVGAPVPEPSGHLLMLVGLGLVGMAVAWRKRV